MNAPEKGHFLSTKKTGYGRFFILLIFKLVLSQHNDLVVQHLNNAAVDIKVLNAFRSFYTQDTSFKARDKWGVIVKGFKFAGCTGKFNGDHFSFKQGFVGGDEL